jgi:pimeloyl-ACP methyl ester carboxylesterase
VHGHGEFFIRDSGGDGPPVLLLHGWMFQSDLNWYRCYGPLAEAGYRVLAIDHRGHGRGIRSRRRFRLEDCADDAVALADVLGIDRFATVGYSAGGPFALACAAGCGTRVSGTALMAGAGPIDDRPGAKEGLAQSDLDAVRLVEEHPQREALLLRFQKWATQLAPSSAVDQVSSELSRPDQEFLARQPAGEEMAFFVESLRQGPAGVMDEYRLWAGPWHLQWSAVTTPVEIFQGEDDGMVPMHHAEDIASRLPEGIARIHRLPGVGHLSIQDHVGDVLDALTTR